MSIDAQNPAAAFLAFPNADGWLAFTTDRADARLAEARVIADHIQDGQSRSASRVLALWNDLDLALEQTSAEAHLMSEAHPDADIREAAELRAQQASVLATELSLDRDLWQVVAELDVTGLDADEARLLERIRRDFRRAGVDLDEETRGRVKELTDRDVELSLTFSRNLREGRRTIRVEPSALAGLPQDFIDARPVGDDGLVELTTDYPDLMPVREYGTDRETRAAITRAHNDVAWPENEPVLAELLAVRAERARLLGYGDWADYETETRMIGSSANVAGFLERLDDVSRDAAQREYGDLLARLRQDVPDAQDVLISDYWHLLSRLREDLHDVDPQVVRSYFRIDDVTRGVLDTTGRLLGLRYERVDLATWHDDVRSYEVFRGDELIGRVHLDLHPRDGKFSHAACFGLVPGVAGRQLPEAVLLCNFSRTLLTHDEVTTFFHEFGHLVHAVVGGGQRFVRFSGIATEWDFVEAPSQMLEEWAWDTTVLQAFARNADGEPIPADLVERMRAADGFGRALEVRRQLGHANTSYRLHVDVPSDLQSATEHWYAVTSPVRPLPGSHTYAGFGHLTGYGSCYYTYQWSLVIARDLLSAFDGDLFDADVSERYRAEVLERGGSRDAADLVETFLGRPYAFDAYRDWLGD